ncbi:MAG: lipoprotein [Gammaproteobacteria bacterium]
MRKKTFSLAGTRTAIIGLLLAIGIVVAGCGQKGNLYLPDQPKPAKHKRVPVQPPTSP